MRFQLISALLFPLALAVNMSSPSSESLHSSLHPAPIVYNNPQDALYEATLFDKSSTTVRGWLTAWAPPNGVGVKIHADFWGLPDSGPYPYHIHQYLVPRGGNCQLAGGHLDPYHRGEQPPCNPNQPETCQVGDLSGKHSPIFVAPGEPFETEYTDLFLSTDPSNPAYIGNRSIVVHAPDDSRLNCGNFVFARQGSS